MKKDNIASWLIRFVKGIFIGSGFILPGVSGGALAAVFGIYERMIKFLANIKKDFKQNLLFFLPVGIGGIFGVFLFSVVLSVFFDLAHMQLSWFFIGCIVGMMPMLWKQAGEHGRKRWHITSMIGCFIGALVFLLFIDTFIEDEFPQNIFTWLMSGGIIALGTLVPGLSASNILLFLNIYQPQVVGIANLDFSIIIPIFVGGLITVIAFSRLMRFVIQKAYSMLFHCIIGFVLASTVLIIPFGYNHISVGGMISIGTATLGVAISRWMCMLDEKYR